MLQTFFVFAGCLSVALGVVGIFIPLLPTTPFLLLAAWCFNRGNQKFHSWLLGHEWLGPPIQDWNKGHIIRPRNKIFSCGMILAASPLLFINEQVPLMGKLAYALFVMGICAYILSRPSQ